MQRFLHPALQRVLVPPRKRRHLLHLGVGDVVRIHAAHPDALAMHLQHHLGGALAGHGEELLQYQHHELHWRKVVVQKHNLEHRRRLQLGPLRLEQRVVLELRHAG
jgi:hypothetical protein